MSEPKVIVAWALLMLVTTVVAALISRALTYAVDLRIVTWVMIAVGSLLLVAGAVLGLDRYSAKQGLAGFGSLLLIVSVLLSCVGVGFAIGAGRTLKRGGRRNRT